jgi:RNA polymerase sigma factor (sigma-70 family)
MTTLPELDSEVGVLKFLKWKTRLLALDVIRLNSRASFAPIDDVPEMEAKVDDFNLELERADDAAIVAMALAKLQPRHREALIATMYEEKSQEAVAAQMNLSDNALRQLLFRARSSFKKALIGEAETQGKSMSEILSIAARKAAKESGKYISAAGAFLLVLAVSIGILPNLGNQATQLADSNSNTIAEPASPSATDSNRTDSNSSNSATTDSLGADSSSTDLSATGSTGAGAQEPGSSAGSLSSSGSEQGTSLTEQQPADATGLVLDTSPNSGSGPARIAEPAGSDSSPTPQATQLPAFSNEDFAQILATNVTQAGFYTSSKAASFSDFFQGESIEIFGGTGISAFVYVNPNTLKLENAMFQMWIDGERYYAIARTSSVSNNGLNLSYSGSNFYVVDDKGRVFDSSPLANATAHVYLTVDANGKPASAAIRVTK